MPFVRPSDAVPFDTHGSRFVSFVSPTRGSRELCAWQLTVPAGLQGIPHRPNREEVLLLLAGEMTVHLDGTVATLTPGDVALVPAGSELRVDGGAEGATAWVTTTRGLEARTPDGTVIRPPWAR